MDSLPNQKRLFDLVEAINYVYGKGDIIRVEFVHSTGIGEGKELVWSAIRHCTNCRNEPLKVTVWPNIKKPTIRFLGQRRQIKWER